MEAIRYYEALFNIETVKVFEHINHQLTDRLSPNVMSKIVQIIESSNRWIDWMIPPVNGDAYSIVDSILVRSSKTKKWIPAPRSLRVELYEMIHFTM